LALPDAGATHFFHKPVSVSRLMECLKNAAKKSEDAYPASTSSNPNFTFPET
jgi:FixJ family two-component response regulator